MSLHWTRSVAHVVCTGSAGTVALLLVMAGMNAGCKNDPPPTVEMGRDLYAVAGCVSCHGREGHGDGSSAAQLKSPPRDFRDVSAFTNGRTVDDIALTIANGLQRKGALMPAFSHLSEQERKSLALFVIALGDRPRESSGPASGTSPGPSARPETGVVARGAWMRAPTPNRDNAAVFVILENAGTEPRTVVGAASEIAERCELHGSSTEGGTMKMLPRAGVEVAAHGRTELRSGGPHIMLFGLKRHPEPGARVPLVLTLDNDQNIAVTVEVRGSDENT